MTNPTTGDIYINENEKPFVVKKVTSIDGNLQVELVAVDWVHVYHSPATLLNLVTNNNPAMSISGNDLTSLLSFHGHSEAFKSKKE